MNIGSDDHLLMSQHVLQTCSLHQDPNHYFFRVIKKIFLIQYFLFTLPTLAICFFSCFFLHNCMFSQPLSISDLLTYSAYIFNYKNKFIKKSITSLFNLCEYIFQYCDERKESLYELKTWASCFSFEMTKRSLCGLAVACPMSRLTSNLVQHFHI